MSELSKQTLLSLRDFIGDALSDPDVTPQEIASAIVDELTELVDYHTASRSKAKEALSLFDRSDSVSDQWREVSDDVISFGDTSNNPYLDWLQANKSRNYDYYDHFSVDSFNPKYKKGRKNKDK